ncbi:MAG: HAD family hydrolase [Candidatus Brocadiae bacterium]|nr:HAD family hydrolase [Candidatus Brocadiia bacterium]
MVVFDLDGTLIDSAGLKREAWFEVFRAAQRPAVERALEENPFADRASMAARILQIAGGRRPPATEVRSAVRRYASVTEAGQASCRERPGAARLVTRLGRRLPVYICSGTEQRSLDRVLSRRGWSGYFRAAYGGPSPKWENLARVAGEAGVRPETLLVVGDTSDDAGAAVLLGCRFVGVHAATNDFDRRRFRMIRDLGELEVLC